MDIRRYSRRIFYKLRKDEPQDIIYSLDYQKDVNEEYFHMFKEAGWNIVISLGNEMHIFQHNTGLNLFIVILNQI